jgi:hypothetical protein
VYQRGHRLKYLDPSRQIVNLASACARQFGIAKVGGSHSSKDGA